MATILERNKKLKPQKKTMQEHAEDALYREVWEDVNNEKTQKFLKKYGKYMIAGALMIMLVTIAIQFGQRAHRAAKLATAANYETALANSDANALVGISKNAHGATADLALWNAYLLSNDEKKLDELAQNGKTRDFRDLAKIHLVGIRGDKMTADELEKFLSDLNTKSSPFYYTACLTIAQKYLSVDDRENANKWLDKIINDSDAPASIKSDAETLR
ncbi:MAG: hypothetical protein IJR92_01540 [Alphaproteobacteria bacterium]|nr:hypothetical protein [Alphaproteobacteria bacterium]